MQVQNKFIELANQYSNTLKAKIDERILEMSEDNRSHYLIYQVLGITSNEGN